MSERTLELILSQMIEAIHNMRAFADGMAFEDYQADPKTKLAMERCVEIISEAARHLPSSVQEKYSDIPWDDIKGIGNILRHGYDKIDDRIIWGVLRRHLAALEGVLARIAEEHGFDLKAC